VQRRSSSVEQSSARAGVMAVRAAASAFLDGNEEKLKLNQYWYSAETIATMVAEIESCATRCAFLSTPSVFFSLNSKQLQLNSKLLDVRRTQPGGQQRQAAAMLPCC
jgi:hypothetical protein